MTARLFLIITISFIAFSQSSLAMNLDESAERKGAAATKPSSSSLKELEREAKKGNPQALEKLGDHYYKAGTHQDTAKAEELYEAAAKKGSVEAKFKLGKAYIRKGDEGEAIKPLTEAAQKGHPDAQFVLGGLLERGEGVKKADKRQAGSWYKEAAKKGHAEAKEALERMSQEETEADR